METVQTVLTEKLLHACEAPCEHLQRSDVRALEERDRAGYSRQPQTPDESRLWEAEAAWPAE
jgi:hypothetical protein